MEYPSFWVVTNPAQFVATFNLFHQQTGAFIPTLAVISAETLAALVDQMPENLRRVPRFVGQPATVLENWL